MPMTDDDLPEDYDALEVKPLVATAFGETKIFWKWPIVSEVPAYRFALTFSSSWLRFCATNQLSSGKVEVPLDRDVDQFPVFELVLKRRSRIWRWSVWTSEGAVVMEGSESSRPAAKYKAARALFLLLLSAPYQSIRMSRADDVRPHRRDASASPT